MLKVYCNYPGTCAYGGILIAAHSVEEAVKIWHDYADYNSYIDDNFKELDSKIIYNDDNPHVIFDSWDFY